MADIIFTIEGKDVNASRILRNLLDNFGALGRIFSDLNEKNFEGAILTGLNAVIDLEKKAIAAASEHETILGKLRGTLESTGRTSEISAGQLEASASALASMSTFDDDSILSAYTAMSKFTSIDSSKLDDIAAAAANMTTIIGGDLAGNAEQIARVLETGLIPRTWGFSQALKDQVKQLIDAGDKGGALELILEKLNEQYGGQAAAQLETYAGQVKQLKNNWGEILETMGGGQLQTGTGIVSNLNKAATSLNQLLSIMGKITEVSAAKGKSVKWWEWLLPPVGAIHSIVNSIGSFSDLLHGKFPETNEEAAASAANVASSIDGIGESASQAGEDLDGLGSSVTDLTTKYSSISSYAQDLTTSMANIADAQKKQADALAKFGANSQEYADATQAVKDLEAAQKRQTDMWVLDVMTQQLATGGLTSTEMAFLLQYQINTGIITQEAALRAQSAYDYALALAGIQDKTVTITTNFVSTGAPPGPGPWHTPAMSNYNGFAGGADFIVPSGYPNDSYPMWVQSGEHVKVTPANQSNTSNMTINVYNPSPEAAEASVSRELIKLAFLGVAQ